MIKGESQRRRHFGGKTKGAIEEDARDKEEYIFAGKLKLLQRKRRERKKKKF
jgi:hypothetical protein